MRSKLDLFMSEDQSSILTSRVLRFPVVIPIAD
jgi:hypothetical protein